MKGRLAWLAHPAARGCEVDDPETTVRRRTIIRDKVFLRRIYEEWYDALAAALAPGEEPALELGSGAGFLRDRVPHVVASDILAVPGLDIVLDATALPFRAASLRGIVMTNVMHHLRDVGAFLREAARCVRPGGTVVMLEPWHTPWSRFIYTRFHPEPFVPDAPDWTAPASGPLSGANGALPWIVFARDRRRFDAEFPAWQIQSVDLTMPFRYVLSGGVSMRALVPEMTFGFWRWLEARLSSCAGLLAMFARIVLVRRDVAGPFDREILTDARSSQGAGEEEARS